MYGGYSQTTVVIGLARSSFLNSTSTVGKSPNSWGYVSDGKFFMNGLQHSEILTKYKANDIIKIIVN